MLLIIIKHLSGNMFSYMQIIDNTYNLVLYIVSNIFRVQ